MRARSILEIALLGWIMAILVGVALGLAAYAISTLVPA